METKINTTIEQSKTLIELGVDPNTADMCYFPLQGCDDNTHYNLFAHKENVGVPSWSLSALLDISPAIDLNKFRGKYKCDYLKDEWSNGPDYTTDFYSNPIDAVFEMVVWLLENRYIKTFKNKN